jgi:hypothetical protein
VCQRETVGDCNDEQGKAETISFIDSPQEREQQPIQTYLLLDMALLSPSRAAIINATSGTRRSCRNPVAKEIG